MTKNIRKIAFIALALAGTAASAQTVTVQTTNSGSPVNSRQSGTTQGNTTSTTATVNTGGRVNVYGGTTTYDPHPDNSRSTTTATAGVSIPW